MSQKQKLAELFCSAMLGVGILLIINASRLDLKLGGVVFAVWGFVGGQMVFLFKGLEKMERTLDEIAEHIERSS